MTFPAILTKRGSALLVFLLAFACIASADTIYNNLNSTTGDSGSIGYGAPLGDSFSTGNSPFSLQQVTLKLKAVHPGDGDSIAVSLLAPGFVRDAVGTLADSSLLTSFADYALTLSTPLALAANTRYWIQLSAVGFGSAAWAFSYDSTALGVPGEYYSTDNGQPAFPTTFGAFQMEVSGAGDPDPAPEAGSLPILLFDLGGLGLIWRGRKRIFASLPNLF